MMSASRPSTGPSSSLCVTLKEGYAILSLCKEPVNSLDLALWQVREGRVPINCIQKLICKEPVNSLDPALRQARGGILISCV